MSNSYSQAMGKSFRLRNGMMCMQPELGVGTIQQEMTSQGLVSSYFQLLQLFILFMFIFICFLLIEYSYVGIAE